MELLREWSMKSLRFALLVVLVSLCTAAFAQTDAQKSFDKLKTLAGSWEGTFEGAPVHVTLRVTSMGNAIVHEMKGSGPEDPITMFYVDGDRLLLTHYCDAGNRPRMLGTFRPTAKPSISIFSTSPAARSPGTCTTRCSP
jgi:hypothetical protein